MVIKIIDIAVKLGAYFVPEPAEIFINYITRKVIVNRDFIHFENCRKSFKGKKRYKALYPLSMGR